jgi:hypothetical protein
MAQGTQAEALLAFLGLLVEPACQPDASFLALDSCGHEASPGLQCEVLTNGVSSIPTLEVEGNSVEVSHYPWIYISKSQVEKVCQTLELCRSRPRAWFSAKAALSPTVSRVWVRDVPPVQLVEGGDSTTKDVLSNELAKKVVPSLTGNRFEVPLPMA